MQKLGLKPLQEHNRTGGCSESMGKGLYLHSRVNTYDVELTLSQAGDWKSNKGWGEDTFSHCIPEVAT